MDTSPAGESQDLPIPNAPKPAARTGQFAMDGALLSPEQQIGSDEISVPVLPASMASDRPAALVEGSLWKAIWTMSWPLMLTTVGTSIVGMVDVQVAGTIGPSAQAAVGLAEQVIFVFMVFLMSLGVGTTAIVSRAYGEKDTVQADFAVGQSLALSILSGIVLTILALFTAHFLLPMFTRAPEVMAQSDLYLSIFSLYIIPFSLICISNSAFRAIGDAKTPLLIVLCEVTINIAGDYITVLGNWPIRGLGIRGIAASATVGAVVGAIMAVIALNRSPIKASLKQLFPIHLEPVKRVLRIGLPAGMQRISWAASVFVLFFILAKLAEPTPALAAWTIGMRVEGLLFMPLMALSLAVGSIVGQNLGAKQVDRAFDAGWKVTGIGVVMMVVLGLLLYVYANEIAAWMTHDRKTISITADYIRINAIAEPPLAVNMILSGALQGAGDTKITMWVSIFTNWFVRLPLAWFLAITLGWGSNGAWISMSVSVTLAAIIIAARFQTRAWAHLKV